MGLDMYLTGRKYLPPNWKDKAKNRSEDGFRIREVQLELGYWRKHPNLHGFIVQTFAGGVDDCREIELSINDLKQIIEAVKAGALPETTGFFFGVSDGSEKAEDIAIFERAIAWLEAGVVKKSPVLQQAAPGIAIAEIKPPTADAYELGWRSVEYVASW